MQKAVEQHGNGRLKRSNSTMNDVGSHAITIYAKHRIHFPTPRSQLATFVETLGPAAAQLGRLDETLLRMKGDRSMRCRISVKLDVDVEQLAGMLATGGKW